MVKVYMALEQSEYYIETIKIVDDSTDELLVIDWNYPLICSFRYIK